MTQYELKNTGVVGAQGPAGPQGPPGPGNIKLLAIQNLWPHALTWQPICEEAPMDGQKYVRQNAAWVLA